MESKVDYLERTFECQAKTLHGDNSLRSSVGAKCLAVNWEILIEKSEVKEWKIMQKILDPVKQNNGNPRGHIKELYETETDSLDYSKGKGVENTDRKLEDLSWKMEKWERAVSQVSLFEEAPSQLESEQEDCVFNLLQDVTQVREDYEQLRSDITEIQQLQRELSECLRTQLHHMHAKYGFLRSKLGPALPSCLMMSTNSYRASPAKHTDSRSDTNSQ